LIIAKNIAHRLEGHFSFLKHYLLLASQRPFNVKALLAELKEFGVERIKIIPLPPEDVKEVPVITYTYQPHPTKMPKKWNVDIKLAINGKLLICSVDVIWLCSRFTEGTKSGKTGYAWIIDKSGHFLAHYEKDFVGANAFKVRGRRAPVISFTRINKLQKEYLLTGKEGVSWYVSGWHRERKGLIKKLIAYTPVHYAGRDNPDKFWSVAVGAPIDEITVMIHGAILRQWIIIGFIIMCLGLAAGASYFMAFQWSKTLEKEVQLKSKELIRAERLAAMGEAIARVAHELKTPLVAIGGFSRQLLRTVSEKEADKLRIIIDETGRLENFVREILLFSKEIQLEKESLDINDVIQEVCEFMGGKIEDNHIILEKKLEQVPLIKGDKTQIRLLFINIIKNAVEAMPKGGTLEVETKKEEDMVEIRIADTGEGIPPFILKDIFMPFFTTKKDGTGLGLSITQKIVDHHQGDIRVESKVGTGTTVWMRLPINMGI
jgi:two-component system sensor histidine kinase HydH